MQPLRPFGLQMGMSMHPECGPYVGIKRVAVFKNLCVLAWAIASGGCYGDAAISVSGRIVDASGAAIEGAKVTLAPAPTSDIRARPSSSRTGDDGGFNDMITFSPAADERVFVLRVEKTGYVTYEETIAEESVRREIVLERREKSSN